mgnify:CR=1 FL=1
MAKLKVDKGPIVVGDYVKVKLSGIGSDAYVVEEIHYKKNKQGEDGVDDYTVVSTDSAPNGVYQHRIGRNGTMFATGTQGYEQTNLRSKLVKL